MTKIYDAKKCATGQVTLFADAIKKANLLHLLLFSSNIKIQTMAVQIDDEYDEIINVEKNQEQPISSLVDGELHSCVREEWSTNEIEGILAQTKTSSDGRTSALYAYLCSKSKQYETERFIYLWMAFNGMYGYFSKVVCEMQNLNRPMQEWKQIQYMLRLLGLGTEVISEKEDKNKIARKVDGLLQQEKRECSVEFLTTEKGKNF